MAFLFVICFQQHTFVMNFKEQIMRNLRQQRKARGLTQQQLQDLTDIPRSWLSILENGLATPNPETRHKIEVVLGKIDWIETGTLKINSASYAEATALIKKLVSITVTMPVKEKKAVLRLIKKYFK